MNIDRKLSNSSFFNPPSTPWKNTLNSSFNIKCNQKNHQNPMKFYEQLQETPMKPHETSFFMLWLRQALELLEPVTFSHRKAPRLLVVFNHWSLGGCSLAADKGVENQRDMVGKRMVKTGGVTGFNMVWWFTGWWFGTCFIFHFIYGIILSIDFHIFQDAYCTTSQKKMVA